MSVPNPNIAPAPSGGRKAIVIAVVFVAVAVSVLLSVLGFQMWVAGQDDSSGDIDDNDEQIIIPPKADIKRVSATMSQATLSGDTTVNIKVTNLGDAIGSAWITVEVTLGTNTYSNYGYVTLAPGETLTKTIVVDTPFGQSVDWDDIDYTIEADD